MRLWSVFWVVPALLAACGDKSAVSLSAFVSDAVVSVSDTAFGSGLAGSFRVQLSLGPEASGSTQVSLGNFSLQTESGAPLVDVLELESDTAFPLQIDKGGSKDVNFTFKQDSADRESVCAGKVRIVGSVMDSLKGGTDQVDSVAITPDCGAT